MWLMVSATTKTTDNENKFWNGQPLAPLKQPPKKETCHEKKEANVIIIGKSCKKWKLIYQIICGLLIAALRPIIWGFEVLTVWKETWLVLNGTSLQSRSSHSQISADPTVNPRWSLWIKRLQNTSRRDCGEKGNGRVWFFKRWKDLC